MVVDHLYFKECVGHIQQCLRVRGEGRGMDGDVHTQNGVGNP